MKLSPVFLRDIRWQTPECRGREVQASCIGGRQPAMARADRLGYFFRPFLATRRLPALTLGLLGGLLTQPVLGENSRQPLAKEETLIAIPTTDGLIPIASGETHYRSFELAAGDFLQAAIDQIGIDLAVRLLGPDGEETIRVDSPNGKYGLEELVEIVSEPGSYRFEVMAPRGAGSGHYRVQETAPRPATAVDRRRVAADRSYRDAQTLLQDDAVPSAIDALESALETWRQLGLYPREADTLERLCEAHRRLGDLKSAASACEQAVAWNRALARFRRLASTLLNTASIHLRFGNLERSREQLDESLVLYQEQGNERGVATVLSRLGNVCYRQGKLQRALDFFARARDRNRALGRASLEASTLTSVGGVLLALHRSREALDVLEEAQKIYRGLEDTRQLARVSEGIAQALVQLGDLERAQRLAEQAVSMHFTFDDLRARALALLHLANVLERRGDLEGAGRAFENTLTLTRQIGDVQSQAVALNSLGHLQAESDDPKRALELHDQAGELFERIRDRRGLASSQVRGGRALRDLGRLEEAWARIEPALDEVEDIRGATVRQDVRLSYFAFRQEYYEIAFDILMRLHDQAPEAGYDDRAIAINDRRLGRELLDAWTLGGGGSRGDGTNPSLLAQERRLEARLRELTGEPATEGHRHSAELIAQLHRVRGEMLRSAAGSSSSLRTLDLVRVREQILDADSLLLIYALGETRSYLWTLSVDGRSAHRLPPRSTLERKAREFVAELVRLRDRSQEHIAELGHELSDLLLAPVVQQLEGRRLIVVSEGELLRLPFAALPMPGSAANFLIEQHEIVTLPSISTLVSLRRLGADRPPPRRSVALFADPVFRSDDPRVAGPARPDDATADGDVMARRIGTWRGDLELSAEQLGADPYRRLLGSRTEAEAILKAAADGRPWLAQGFEANREALLKVPFEDFGVLHLATHALLHPQPELSGIVLSLIDEAGRQRNGFLRAFEISRLNVPVDLVVLSACETGRGIEARGEGILSLAWRFLQAGAARVIASLWKISDPRTAELMTVFYNAYLREGEAPPAALRKAQLALLEQPGSRPYDWAAFVFQGDWRHPRHYVQKP